MSEQLQAPQKDEPIRSPGSALAAEWYGPDKPAEAPKVAKPEVDDPPKSDDPPELVADPDDPPKGEVVDDDHEGGDPQEVELSSLEELAEHFELDPEWLQGLTIKQKVNGEEVEVKLAEALASHRKVKSADQYLADANKRRDEIITETKQQQEELTGTIATFSKLLESVESELDRDVKGIDWNKLRADDPAEYAVKKDEIRERRDRLSAMKKEAKEAVSQSLSSHQKKSEEAIWEDRKKRAPEEKKVLLEAFPEWKDQERWKAEQEEAVAYMKELGASENQIVDTLYRGRALSTIVKAMRYDKAKAKAGAAKKKVVVPKVLKPGSKKDAPKANGKDWNDTKGILYG